MKTIHSIFVFFPSPPALPSHLEPPTAKATLSVAPNPATVAEKLKRLLQPVLQNG